LRRGSGVFRASWSAAALRLFPRGRGSLHRFLSACRPASGSAWPSCAGISAAHRCSRGAPLNIPLVFLFSNVFRGGQVRAHTSTAFPTRSIRISTRTPTVLVNRSIQTKPGGAMRRVKCRTLRLHMPPITVFQRGLVRPLLPVFGRTLVTQREGLQNRKNNSRVWTLAVPRRRIGSSMTRNELSRGASFLFLGDLKIARLFP
jgi:hypothetical protein